MNSTEYFLAPRVDETCTGDKEWYSCSVGDYKGCCSSDPCTTGLCPDDDAATTSTETKTTKTTSTKTTKNDTTKTDTTKTETTETTKTTSDTTTTTSTSSSLTTLHTTTSSVSTTSSTSVVQITYLHQSTTVTAPTSTSTSTNKSTQSNSSNHGAIIGGIIGSIAGLLVIILVLFCIRKRRRSTKDSYALGFKPKPISATDTHYIGYSGSDPATSAFYSRSPIDYRCLPRPLFDRDISHTSSSEPSTLSKLLAPHNSSKASLSIKTKVPASTTLTSPLPTPTLLPPRTQKSTPELPDTGLDRQRVELASYSQRELINIPLDQRIHPEPQRDKDHKPDTPWISPLSTGFPDASGSGMDQILSPVSRITNDSGPIMSMSPPLQAQSTPRQLITNDGVVLEANLNHYFSSSSKESAKSQNEKKVTTPPKEIPKPSPRPKPASPPQEHVMSFMNFEESICSDQDPTTAKKKTSHEGTFLNMDSPLSPGADSLPAYESGGINRVADSDVKSPSRMSARRGFP